MDLSPLPTRPDGCIRWREWYDTVRPGQKFILSADMFAKVNSSRRDARHKIEILRNRDGHTITVSILAPRSERTAMLAAFSSLSNVQLKAVLAACKTAGLLPP